MAEYRVGGGGLALTPYICTRLLSIEHAILHLTGSMSESNFLEEAIDHGLMDALKSGTVKALAFNGNTSYLLPPAFWKFSNGLHYSVGAMNAFGKGIVDNMIDVDRIDGLRDAQGWDVALDENSFETWCDSKKSKDAIPKLEQNANRGGTGFLRKRGRPKGSGGLKDDAHVVEIHRLVTEEGFAVFKACDILAAEMKIDGAKERSSTIDRWRKKYVKKYPPS